MKKNKIVNMVKKTFGYFRRLLLKNRNFTIISNNCWGGSIYQEFNLEYLTPTIGLYFFADDYIEFLKNLPEVIKNNLEFINYKESIHYEDLKLSKYDYSKCVIGRLNEKIEIIFLHYCDIFEAKQKWDRRKKRINFDNIIIKCNDQNGFSQKNYTDFINLPYKNKILFTANLDYCDDCCVFFDKYKNSKYVIDDMKSYKKYINIRKYINGINNEKNHNN